MKTPKNSQILWQGLLFLVIYLWGNILVYAEYRAYELEVFDKLQNKKEVLRTSFAPSDYIATNGGPQRISVVIRASWICRGNTSLYKPICAIPDAINPKFNLGETVQVQLNPHLTHLWNGIIENRFYREDLKSNVYGVRFPEHQNLYTRYYESHLKAANSDTSKTVSTSPDQEQ